MFTVRSTRSMFVKAAAVTVAGVAGFAGAAAADTPPVEPQVEIVLPEATCPKDGKIDVAGNHSSVTVVAPDGMLIVGYCVKAGSANQGDGPETVWLAEPQAEVTFSHSSGKDISHYTVFYVDEPVDDKTPPPVDEPDTPDDITLPEDPQDPEVPDDITLPEEPQDPEVPGDVINPDEPVEPEAPQDFEAEVEAPQPEPQPEPAPQQPQAEVPVASGELPVTGSTTTLLAVIAGLVTAAGVGVRRLVRPTV